MENLSLVLWRERELLETLLFKLEEEQLVLASGRTHWLAPAAREIESVLESIRETELMRAVVADAAAASIGLEPSPSLRALADALDEPWKTIFVDHRDAFLSYTRQIMEMASSNRDLLTAGYQAARDTLQSLGHADAAGYSPNGSLVADAPRPRLVDRSI